MPRKCKVCKTPYKAKGGAITGMRFRVKMILRLGSLPNY